MTDLQLNRVGNKALERTPKFLFWDQEVRKDYLEKNNLVVKGL